jgi:zinc transport system permease protein
MAMAAAAVGLVSVASGLTASLVLDVPSGPAVVVAAALLFAVSLLPGPPSRRIG